MISTFMMMAGFIVGLGAVTVIDILGFLGRKSSYWTQATIRTHKVTKPLIWIGIVLVLIGHALVYEVIPILHICIIAALIVNGLFLSLHVSPFLLKQEKQGKDTELLPLTLQYAIAVSFVVSFVGWWGLLWLVVQTHIY